MINIAAGYALEVQMRNIRLVHPCRYPSCLLFVCSSKASEPGLIYTYAPSHKLCRVPIPKEIQDKIKFIVRTMEL